MTSKRSRAKASAAPGKTFVMPAPDDLKQLRGVGPAVERCLHRAGIRTLAQLAAASPEKIAASDCGLTAKRIARENWIGQARRLAHTRAKRRPNPPDSSALREGRQHYATFTVELLLDKANKARRTRCVHIQSGDQETWAAWDEARLVRFVADHSRLRLPRAALAVSPAQPERVVPPSAPPQPAQGAVAEAEPAPARALAAEAADTGEAEAPSRQSEVRETPLAVSEAESVHAAAHEELAEEAATDAPLTPAEVEEQAEATGRELSGGLRLGSLVVTTADSDQPRQMLPAGAPFRVRLGLDLAGIKGPRDARLDCLTTIWAKPLGGGGRQIIGERRVEIERCEKETVEVEGRTLPSGLYRLEVMVSLNLSSPRPLSRHGLVATLTGGLLQVH